jgi:hypothetical protein
MNFSHKLEGGKELERFLKQFPVKTERKYLVKGLRGAIKRIKSRVRREIKANFRKNTGVLLRSVKHRTLKAKFGAKIVIENSSIENETKRIGNKTKRNQKIKTLKIKKESGKFRDAYYARFLIKGTKRGIKANPYLDRALEGEEKNAKEDFNAELIKAFENDAMKMLMK